jgi:hypothetical protein
MFCIFGRVDGKPGWVFHATYRLAGTNKLCPLGSGQLCVLPEIIHTKRAELNGSFRPYALVWLKFLP